MSKKCRSGNRGFAEELTNFTNNPHKFTTFMKGLKYILSGELAVKLSLYNQLKEAVEFMTPDAIQIDKVTLIEKTIFQKYGKL